MSTYRAVGEAAAFGHAEEVERRVGLDEAVDDDVRHVHRLGPILARHRLRTTHTKATERSVKDPRVRRSGGLDRGDVPDTKLEGLTLWHEERQCDQLVR